MPFTDVEIDCLHFFWHYKMNAILLCKAHINCTNNATTLCKKISGELQSNNPKV